MTPSSISELRRRWKESTDEVEGLRRTLADAIKRSRDLATELSRLERDSSRQTYLFRADASEPPV